MNKLILPIFLLLGMTTQVWAQQPSQYSLYMLNPYGYNTAYAGLDESLSITGVFRKQWVNLPGSPMSFQFNAHMPLEYINSGVGLSVEHDRLGAQFYTHVQGSYNYIIDMKKAGQLSFGGALAWTQAGIDGSILRAADGVYEGNNIFHNDDLIPEGQVSGSALGVHAGIYYKHKFIEGGFGTTYLNTPMLEWDATNGQRIRYARSYFGMIRGNVKISEDLSLQPSLLVKTDFVGLQAEIGTILTYRDNIFGGLAFRGYNNTSTDAVVFVVGMQVNKKWTFAYAYDLSVSQLSGFNAGSHEIMVNYNLREKIGKEIPAKIIYNPRFL